MSRTRTLLNDVQLSEHFSLREFQCRCCGAVKIYPPLLLMLERLRELRGSPLVLTSGYRCGRHNEAVGGSSTSLHKRGRAADILVPGDEQRRLADAARAIGFSEVIEGGNKNYLHVAIR